MSAKLFSVGLCGPHRRVFFLLVGAYLSAATGIACRSRHAQTRPAAAVEAAVTPSRFAPAFRKLGASHFRCVARFEASVRGSAPDVVTTETDLWMDRKGNWRLVEINDKDGGREIVLHGRELAVALRYGKMIRRPAEDPEPQQLLEEGVGAPFAAWDLMRAVSTVDDFGEENRAGRRVHVYKLTKPAKEKGPGGKDEESLDLRDHRAWRRTLVPSSVEGTIAVDEASGLPLQADIRARYTMRRPTPAGTAGKPPNPANGKQNGASSDGQTASAGGNAYVEMEGAIEVRAAIENIGQSPEIARPEAEDSPARARTVPEEKALLGGLPGVAAAPKAER